MGKTVSLFYLVIYLYFVLYDVTTRLLYVVLKLCAVKANEFLKLNDAAIYYNNIKRYAHNVGLANCLSFE